jgi:two-component system sensor histidine kinase HupT/HoxJ
MGDKDKIETVILNLVNNAIDAVPQKGGAITVQTRRAAREQNGAVEIAVADNGSGLSPEAYDRLFEPFFTTKPAAKGTGLGLFLSYGIVREHKGEIVAMPNRQGSGSVFVVTLPGLEVRVPQEA